MSAAERTIADLAEEAGDCIEDNALRGAELRAYLLAWIAECLRDERAAVARVTKERDVALGHLHICRESRRAILDRNAADAEKEGGQ